MAEITLKRGLNFVLNGRSYSAEEMIDLLRKNMSILSLLLATAVIFFFPLCFFLGYKFASMTQAPVIVVSAKSSVEDVKTKALLAVAGSQLAADDPVFVSDVESRVTVRDGAGKQCVVSLSKVLVPGAGTDGVWVGNDPQCN